MAKERFLINPVKKRKPRKKAGTKSKGGHTMAKGKKRVSRRRKRNAAKRSAPKVKTKTIIKYKYRKAKAKKRRRRNPALASVGSNPRRSVKRRKRRTRRNPVPFMKQVTKALPLFVTGGIGVTAVSLIPNMLKIQNQWLKYGVQLGIAIGGGAVAGKAMKNKQHGTAFMIGGGSAILYDIMQKFVLTPMGLSQYELNAFPGYADDEYINEQGEYYEDGVGGVDAYNLNAYDLDDEYIDDGDDDYDMSAFPVDY